MLVTWMAYASLLTALLAVAGIAGESLARVCAAPRRLIWALVLSVATIAPPLLAVRPATRASTSSSASSQPASTSPSPVSTPAPISFAERHSSPTPPRQTPIVPAVANLAPYAMTAWLLASAALLGIFALAVIRLRIQSHGWRPAVVDDVPVLVSRDIGPAVIGTLRPRIVVAEWTLALDTAKRALMLRHELEHIRAYDPLLLRLATLSLVAFPWNPALWFVVRRLRQSVEIDCDSRVLGATDAADDSPRDYGMLLLLVGARRTAPLPIAAAFTGYPPFLERRIKAMTSRPPRRPTLLSLGLLSLTVASTIAATRAPLPPSLRPTMHATPKNASRDQQTPIPRPSAASSPLLTARIITPSSPSRTPAAAPLALVDTNPPAARDESTISGTPFSLAPPQGHPTNREATGRVLDSATNSPLANVYVSVIGIQALNAPNWTCSDANGVFRLRVPIGEAWLFAQAADHAFNRVTLAPADSSAVLRGAFVPPRPAPVGPPPDQIASVTVTPYRSFNPTIVIDGIPQPPQGDSVHLTIRTVNGAVVERDVNRHDPRPRFFVDGVEVGANTRPAPFTSPCAK